jgi:formate hydrogenlyase transcriptional activator
MKRRITSIPTSAMTALQEWEWPGNIRELENVIERAVIISSGEVLQVPPFQMTLDGDVLLPPAELTPYHAAERDVILEALRETGGVIAGPEGAAARLGMKRTTLQSKMRKLGIRRPSF